MLQPRRHDVSRLEGFSDAVFGFALTLLVVSLETPKTTDDLRRLLGGLLPFAVTFAMVCWIWYQHNIFFRRYGLQDAWTVFLNCALLFVVLFYVYPLKFLAGLLLGGDPRSSFLNQDGRAIMFMYSSGVLVLFTTFVLLHWHAWRSRLALGLDERELLTLRFSTRAHVFSASIAIASLVLLVVVNQSMYAGIVYGLMGPLHAWNGFKGGAAQEALKKKLSAPAEELQRDHKTDDEPGR